MAKGSSSYTLMVATLAFAGVGAAVAYFGYRYQPQALLTGSAVALFGDAVLLSLAKENGQRLLDVAELLDDQPLAVRERYGSYLGVKHREFETAVFVQYALLVGGAVLFGLDLPGVDKVPALRNLLSSSDLLRAMGLTATAFAVLPSLVRLLAAPRRIFAFRQELVTDLQILQRKRDEGLRLVESQKEIARQGR